MRHILRIFGIGCFGVVMVGTAMAAQDRFAMIDADKDGKIVVEEFMKAMPQMRQSAFDAIDSDKNAHIDRSEWDGFMKNHGKGGMGAQQQEAKSSSKTLPIIQPPKAK